MTAPATRADEAYSRIIELIASREIRESDPISHRSLAERLGMSKLPVSRALDRLQREGLLNSQPRVGTRLRPFDADNIWGMLQWRSAIECQSARLAAECSTGTEKKELIVLGRKTDVQLSKVGPEKGHHPLDAEFHRTVARLSRVTEFEDSLDRLSIYHIKVQLCEAVSAAAQKPPSAPPDHQAVARAIATGDPGIAEVAMREHLENSERAYGFVRWYRQYRLENTALNAG